MIRWPFVRRSTVDQLEDDYAYLLGYSVKLEKENKRLAHVLSHTRYMAQPKPSLFEPPRQIVIETDRRWRDMRH